MTVNSWKLVRSVLFSENFILISLIFSNILNLFLNQTLILEVCQILFKRINDFC